MFQYLFPRYTIHVVWICGGRDWEDVIIRHWLGRRQIMYTPSKPMKDKAVRGEELNAGLESSIDIACQGKFPITGWQVINALMIGAVGKDVWEKLNK